MQEHKIVSIYYSGCMAEQMPCGMFVRRKRENRFFKEYPTATSHIASEWLSYVEDSNNVILQHARRGGEYRIGQWNIAVDGFCKSVRFMNSMLSALCSRSDYLIIKLGII